MRIINLEKSLLLGALLFGLSLMSAAFNASGAENGNTIYNPNPNHLWNRLNETLFVRTAPDGKKYGLDELDILYWRNTKHLLVEPSHHKALTILDEFIDTHGEKLIRDPLKRSLLQRDLWELFDWSARSREDPPYPREREKLQRRLVVAIHRLALTTNQIASLPDNYAKAVKNSALTNLPRGLFQTTGDWVSLGISGDHLAASAHVSAFKGRSAFFVMLRLPDGRQSALSYLDKLRSFERPLIYATNASSSRETLTLNPDLPQFPTNTEWALVRRMSVIDTEGRIQPTRITESIQLRRYLEIGELRRVVPTSTNRHPAQLFFEFQLDRRNNGTLRAIREGERAFEFVHFMGHGIDVFESSSATQQQRADSLKFQSEVLKTCSTCHGTRGIFSVNSYTRNFSSPPRPADLSDLDIEREATMTINWKQRQFDWGLLQGIWHHGD